MDFYSFFIALAVSVDSFSIGVAYGIKNIKIPLLSMIIINSLCVLSFSISLIFGNAVSLLISPNISNAISAIILLCLGIWLLLQTVLNSIISEGVLRQIRIKSLGIVINILKEPMAADADISGNIDNREAFFLGLALSLDSLAAGFGASIGRINVIASICILAIINWFFLRGGIKTGQHFNIDKIKSKINYIPVAILIGLGIIRLL